MRVRRDGEGADVAARAERLRGELTGTGPPLGLVSPVSGETVVELPSTTAEDLVGAAERARAAQADWSERPVPERARFLLDLHDAVLDRRDVFVDLLQVEGGKARLSAAEEVLHVALTARYYARTAERYLGPERGQGLLPRLTRIDRLYRPKGLVGVIGPWNYPFTMAVSDGLAALVAGNAVLVKPDQQTPLVSLEATALLRSLGLPRDLWQVVHGPGAVLGPALIDVSDYVCFTGSTATGRTVARRCADRLIGCSLELGGKNPLVVLADADPVRAAEGAVRASFSNAGQLCVSTERIYVAEPLFDRFVAELAERARALSLGHRLDFGHDVAGLINPQQLDRVARHVQDAVAKGAVVRAGGRARPDLGRLVYEPTVLTGVTPAMACYAEETFGPVVAVYPVADEDEAVRRANDSDYGLNASVWSGDPAHGRAVAARIRCGTVNVNEGFAATFGSIDAPMGGMKQSGLGRRQGREGLRRFVEVQSVGTQTGVRLAPGLGLDGRRFVSAMTLAMRLMRRLGRP